MRKMSLMNLFKTDMGNMSRIFWSSEWRKILAYEGAMRQPRYRRSGGSVGRGWRKRCWMKNMVHDAAEDLSGRKFGLEVE